MLSLQADQKKTAGYTTIYIHIYIQTHLHINIHTNTHKNTHTHTHTFIQMHTHTHHIHTHTQKERGSKKESKERERGGYSVWERWSKENVCTHTRARARTRTHTHITHTWIYMWPRYTYKYRCVRMVVQVAHSHTHAYEIASWNKFHLEAPRERGRTLFIRACLRTNVCMCVRASNVHCCFCQTVILLLLCRPWPRPWPHLCPRLRFWLPSWPLPFLLLFRSVEEAEIFCPFTNLQRGHCAEKW